MGADGSELYIGEEGRAHFIMRKSVRWHICIINEAYTFSVARQIWQCLRGSMWLFWGMSRQSSITHILCL